MTPPQIRLGNFLLLFLILILIILFGDAKIQSARTRIEYEFQREEQDQRHLRFMEQYVREREHAWGQRDQLKIRLDATLRELDRVNKLLLLPSVMKQPPSPAPIAGPDMWMEKQ